MKGSAIFAATLGLSQPWQITSVSFAKDKKRLDITVEYSGEKVMSCPRCGKEGNTLCTEAECWYHDNFFRYQTYLHAHVPSAECSCCGSFQVERPWSRKGSRFTLINQS
jgi:transposase